MKLNAFYIALAGMFIVACGNSPEGIGQLEKLISQRDSLKAEHAKLGEELAALEYTIGQLDTTQKLTKVTTMALKPSRFQHYFEIFGSVEADENVQLFPELPGEILQVMVNEGDRVTKGQTLMRLDSDILQRNIAEVETSLSLATDIYNRQKRLWDKKIGSEVQYLEAKNSKESLEKRLETLRTQQEQSTIKAPFAGVIDEIFSNEGEMANPAMPLIRLVNLREVYIQADVSERYVASVQAGTEVTVRFSSLNQEVDTRVALAGKFINPNNRTFRIRVPLENTDDLYKPNMLAALKIKDFEQDSAVVVPANLVQQSAAGDNFIYVLDRSTGKSQVRKVNVAIGLSYEDRVLVTDGLSGNEVLIDRGSRSVKDGQDVQVMENV